MVVVVAVERRPLGEEELGKLYLGTELEAGTGPTGGRSQVEWTLYWMRRLYIPCLSQ